MNALWWAVLTASIWGVVPIIEKTGLKQVEPLVGLFYRSLGIIVGMTVFGFFLLKPEQIRAVEFRSASLLILSGFLASFVAQIAFYYGLRIGDVSRFVPISASYPLITFFLGVLIFKEAISVMKLAGVFLIICGVWMLKVS